MKVTVWVLRTETRNWDSVTEVFGTEEEAEHSVRLFVWQTCQLRDDDETEDEVDEPDIDQCVVDPDHDNISDLIEHLAERHSHTLEIHEAHVEVPVIVGGIVGLPSVAELRDGVRYLDERDLPIGECKCHQCAPARAVRRAVTAVLDHLLRQQTVEQPEGRAIYLEEATHDGVLADGLREAVLRGAAAGPHRAPRTHRRRARAKAGGGAAAGRRRAGRGGDGGV